jgi:hypothetical protein
MVTMDSGEDVSPYHHRQIVPLPRDRRADWLDPSMPSVDVLGYMPTGILPATRIYPPLVESPDRPEFVLQRRSSRGPDHGLQPTERSFAESPLTVPWAPDMVRFCFSVRETELEQDYLRNDVLDERPCHGDSLRPGFYPADV